MNPHGCDRRKPGRMPAATHWRRCPPRPRRWSGRRPRARRCRAAGADRRRGPGQSAIAPAGHAGDAALPALLQLIDARAARAPARPPNPPRKPRPMPLPKMPSLSVRPSWPIRCRACWPALEPGRLRHLVAGPGPTARRPALDATRRRQRHRLRPGPARQPRALRANAAAGAVPQDNAIDPGHEYTLAELIDLAQSSNPRTRIAWNAARNAALATGMVKSVYLPQLAATAMTGWRHSNGSSNIGLGDSSSNSSTHGTVGVLAAMAAVRLRRPAGACRPPNRRPSPATSP